MNNDPNQPLRPIVPPFPEGGHPARTPKPQKHTGRTVLIVAGCVTAFLTVVGLGAAAIEGSPAAETAAASPQPTVTVTAPAEPGAEVTVTAPPVTVTKPAPPAKTVTQAPPEAAAAIDGDGTYEVGVDIKPGKYKTVGGEGCYWARLSNLDGGFEAIIANEFSNGRQTVTVKKSDRGFKTSGCGEWTKVG
jgi:hypothetical protein